MPGFNLVDQPWIPCQLEAELRARDLSLREALLRAHEVRDLATTNPVVTATLLRLLLAILHRAHDGPKSPDEWWAIHDDGHFDPAVIDRYLDRWRPRFDLFDADRPFYQAPGLDMSLAKPAGVLFHETKVDNDAALFNRGAQSPALALSPAEAARQVLVQQATSLGGLITYQKHEPINPYKYAEAALLVNVAVFVVCGRTLFETLLLNLNRYDPSRGYPFVGDGRDLPAWERDQPVSVAARPIAGLTDLLTWQSRRILLGCDAAGMVTSAAIMKGESLVPDQHLQGREAMAAFRARRNAKEGEPWEALRFSEDRAFWRDSLVFLARRSVSDPPSTLKWLAQLGLPRQEQMLRLRALGMASNQAKPGFWRDERLDVPAAFLEDDSGLLEALERSLALAEAIGELLGGGMVALTSREGKPVYADAPLRRLTRDLTGNADNARDFVRDSLGAARVYWAALEPHFRTLLADLPAQPRDANTAVVSSAPALVAWRTALQRAAEDAFESAVGGLVGSRRGLAAVGAAEHEFRRHLGRIFAPYKEETEVPV